MYGRGYFPTAKKLHVHFGYESAWGPTDGADGVMKRKFSVINVVFMAIRLKTKLIGCDAVQFGKFSSV
jgi:hypothetical protein